MTQLLDPKLISRPKLIMRNYQDVEREHSIPTHYVNVVFNSF